MKNTVKLMFVLVVGLIFLFPIRNYAQINVVTSAVPMLRISPDARTSAMGDIGVATDPDVFASFWNMGKPSFLSPKFTLGLTYVPWFRDFKFNDMYYGALYGAYRLGDKQTLTASVRYFNLGSVQFTDNSGAYLESYNPHEFALDVGYSTKLNDKLGLGGALRYVNSNLAKTTTPGGITYKPASTLCFDLGVYYNNKTQEGRGLTAGATLKNIGPKIAYTNAANSKDFMPANLALGATYTYVFDEQDKLMLGLDINRLLVPWLKSGATPEDLTSYHQQSVLSAAVKSFTDSLSLKRTLISLGTEYTYNNSFMFRLGYFWEDNKNGARKYFTVGAGVNYKKFTFNFSYWIPSGVGVNRDPVSNTLRFSLMFNLSGEETGNREDQTIESFDADETIY